MIRSAVIFLDTEAASAFKSPGRTLAGLPWLARWIIVASRAGVENFFVIGGENLERTRLRVESHLMRAGVRVSWIHASHTEVFRQMVSSAPEPSGAPWLVSLWNVHLPRTAWEPLHEKSSEGFLLSDREGVLLAGLSKQDLLSLSDVFHSGAQLLREATRRLSLKPLPPPEGVRRLATRGDARGVRRALFQGLIKDTEGFMSRHVERKISFAMTRLLIRFPIHPNAVTLFNIALGVWSGVLLASPDRWIQVKGALLFLATSILDGCDGEIARLKFLESKWGGWLDFLGDNVVHVAVFWGIALGVARAEAQRGALLLGTLAVAGTVSSSLFVFFRTLRRGREASTDPFFTSVASAGPGRAGRLARIDDALSRRDFIYLIVVLSLAGRLEWFLWLSAVGAPLFFATLLVIHLRESSFKENPA